MIGNLFNKLCRHVRMRPKARGFTLIETLIAVMILAVTISGPLSIAARSLNNSLVAKEQIVAFFLAQDGVEYVRYVRDTNTLKSGDWITGVGGTGTVDLTPCLDANGCQVDTTSNTPYDIPTVCSATCDRLYYDSVNMRYTYTTSGSGITKTVFTRKIALTNINSHEYKLTVTVSWQDLGNTTRQVTVNENIFAWQ